MVNFKYYTPTKVFFGKEQEKQIGEIIASYGYKKILIHYGKESVVKSRLLDKVKECLKASKIAFVELGGVSPNPKLSLALKGVEIAKKEKVELILAIGGGSVIDSAKLIAAGAMVDFNPWRFSIKEEIPKITLPVGVILTISASGSDMSDSCVITNEETKEKRGFNYDINRPLFAILNPELTYTVSPYQTACGTVDILMHTFERYFSLGPESSLTDNIALGLMKSVIEAGKKAKNDPKDYEARATLMWANSLSHNGLTACGRKYVMSVHQLEHELSGMFDEIAHGAGLAVLWPNWARLAYPKAMDRFLPWAYEVMKIEPTTDKSNDVKQAINRCQSLFEELGMPTTLRQLNVPESALTALAENYTFHGKRVLEDIIIVDYETALKIYKMSY